MAAPAVIPVITTILEGLGIEQGAKEIAGGIVHKISDIGSALGSNEQSQVQMAQVSLNELANTIKSLGVTNAQFTDPEQLFAYVRGNYSVSGPSDLIALVDQLKEFLQAAKISNLMNIDSNLVNDVFTFAFTLYKRSNYNYQSIQRTLSDLTQKASDPLQDAYVISVIKNNYSMAMAITLMQNFGNVNAGTMREMQGLGVLANRMLGAQAPVLLDMQALSDAKNKTALEKLYQDQRQMLLMIPAGIHKQQMVQGMYQKLEGLYGSDFAKGFVNSPLMGIYILASALKQTMNGLTAGGAEAMAGNNAS